jgi:outer membrane protein
VNYTIFFDENVDNQLIDLLSSQTGRAVNGAYLDLDNSWNLALQAGVDIPIDEHWAFNVGIWYIDIGTTAEITAKADGVTAATVKFDVDLDPWVYNVGIAYKF